MGNSQLRVVPVELADANAFVARFHRHHQPCVGHRFSLGVVAGDGLLVGVAVVGRPVARLVNWRTTVEVSRLCTDGTPNACSVLYGAAARVAKHLGFERIQTYTLPEEGGVSLRAAGWTNEGEAGGGQWKHTDGRPRRSDQPVDVKWRWVRELNPAAPEWRFPDGVVDDSQLVLA